jgi:hypothetical protein
MSINGNRERWTAPQPPQAVEMCTGLSSQRTSVQEFAVGLSFWTLRSPPVLPTSAIAADEAFRMHSDMETPQMYRHQHRVLRSLIHRGLSVLTDWLRRDSHRASSRQSVVAFDRNPVVRVQSGNALDLVLRRDTQRDRLFVGVFFADHSDHRRAATRSPRRRSLRALPASGATVVHSRRRLFAPSARGYIYVP